MCAIVGTIGGDEDLVVQMLERLKHRGPDGHGVEHAGNAIHGHARLALLDPSSASAQPFQQGVGLLCFNGEIWNYRELRAELEAAGREFLTTGDTEVLAIALDTWGIYLTYDKLDGMFAFAWSKEGRTWLARDPHGKIPLYVLVQDMMGKTTLSWASERKAFNVGDQPHALPAGNILRCEDLVSDDVRQPSLLNIQPEPADVMAWLRRGVAQRLNADAPVCCLISGGLDSSIILALAAERTKNLTAYTAFVDETGNDDLKAARKLCAELGVKHVEVRVEPDAKTYEDALLSIEIPSKAQIEIAALCLPLAARISADGFKACLSGEAADELFGGYGNFCIQASRCDDAGIVALRQAQLAKMARGNFVRCNKAFMAHGVECRLPFMVPALVESVVHATKASNPPGKKLLKAAAAGIVPDWIIKRTKETFQGASGSAGRAESLFTNPKLHYNSEIKRRFGYLPRD